MSSVLNYCDSVARYSHQANDVIQRITATTTPIEFEELRQRFPQFQLDHANRNTGTVLHEAAKVGNVPLIEYIVRQAPQLLDRGGNSYSQYTPLWLAIGLGNVEAAESLISLGANVNIINHVSNDSLLGCTSTLYNINPRLRKIVKLLIKNGAELPPSNCEVQYSGTPRSQHFKDRLQSIVERFTQEIAKERKKTSDTLSETAFFPKDLSNMIVDYS